MSESAKSTLKSPSSSTILLSLPSDLLSRLEARVSARHHHYLNSKAGTPSRVEEAKKIAAAKGVTAANRFLRQSARNGRPPSRTSVALELLRRGIEAEEAAGKQKHKQ